MLKIREDLEGVVIITTGPGATITLAAGDKVPRGITVGDHLTSSAVVETPEADAAEPETDNVAPEPQTEPETPTDTGEAGPYAAAPKARGRK